MKKFVELELEIVRFDLQDVIATSNDFPNIGEEDGGHGMGDF